MPMAAAVTVGVLLASASSGMASTKGHAAKKSQQVVLGLATAQSGALSGYDIPDDEAVELAVAKINSRGGLLGHKVQVVMADTDSNINQGGQAGTSVISKGANVMIVTPDYNYGGGAARVANQHHIPVLSAAGSSLFGPVGIGPYAYSTGYSVTSEGYADAQWAFKTKGFKTAYVLDDTSTDADQEQCAGFTKHYEALGGKVVGTSSFLNSDTSIAAQITAMKSASTQPKFLLLCSYPPGGATAVQQLRAAGVNVPILAEQAFDGTYWFAKTMPKLTNFYYLSDTSRYGDDPDAVVNNFWKTFDAKYGNPAAGFPPNYYAGVMAFAAAIKKAGTVSGPAVIKQLNKMTNLPGVLPITYSAKTHLLTNLPMRMMQIKNGKPSYSSTVKLAAAPPQA
jgi:branched-chain amino acid transport system substrate-binding protein